MKHHLLFSLELLKTCILPVLNLMVCHMLIFLAFQKNQASNVLVCYAKIS